MMFEVESITPGTMTLTSSSATRMAQPASATAGPCAKLRVAWANPNAGEAEAALMSLARQLDKVNPDAAASLREGLADTLTVTRLGITGTLLKTVMSTNPVESMIEIVRAHARNVKRWQDGDMRLRWAAAGMIAASSQFRRVKGHRQLPALAIALRHAVGVTDPSTPQSPPEHKITPGYSSDRTIPGQVILQGWPARGRSMVGGWPRLPGGAGGACFACGSTTKSR